MHLFSDPLLISLSLLLGVSALISPVGSCLRVVFALFVFCTIFSPLFAEEQQTLNHFAQAVLVLWPGPGNHTGSMQVLQQLWTGETCKCRKHKAENT